MLQGLLKVKPTCDPRLLINPDILLKLLQLPPTHTHTTDSYFARTLFRAMFILAYCVFLRVGEIIKTKSKAHHYISEKMFLTVSMQMAKDLWKLQLLISYILNQILQQFI